MAEQPTTERDCADAPDTREGRRFSDQSRRLGRDRRRDSLGVAYFVIPEETAKQASDRKPPPEARVEVPQPIVNRDEVPGMMAREKSGEERTAGTKGDTSSTTDAGRSETEML